MKFLLIACLLLVSFTSFSQTNYLSGNTVVQKGAQETYYTHFSTTQSQTPDGGIVSWNVIGGTILYYDDLSCTVQWENTNGTGEISAYETIHDLTGSLDVQIGDPVPGISPNTQNAAYNTIPGAIAISFNVTPPASVIYNWQEWNPVTSIWIDLNQHGTSFSPPVVLQDKKYRCLVTVNGTTYENLESTIYIPQLSPGTLLVNGSGLFDYNTPISGIVALPASGGYCEPGLYTYVWEQSIEGGPWTQIGTQSNPPTFAPITGNVRIRRGVNCGGTLLYTNILSFDPNYSPVDFENLNYVREITVAKKGIQSWQEADQLEVGNKFQTTTYLDGLGRSVQSVSKGVSSTDGIIWKDLVKHVEYDAAGRALKGFLSYPSATNPGKFKTAAATEQPTAIQNLYGEPLGAPTYTLSVTDESPLNRVIKVTPPGQGWSGAAVSTDVDFNTKLSDKVHIWSLAYTTGALPITTSDALYEDGTLLKTVTTQEGKQIVTYTDLNGNVILKKVQLATALTDPYDGWICTYNIYDDFGRLCYQLQPEAVKYLNEHDWTFDANNQVLNGLCFQYRYDDRGRNTWKKAPGAEALQMIYDERDRLVFTQDGNQRTKSEWTVNLFDELNRPVITLLYHTSKTVNDLQTALTGSGNSLVPISNSGEPIVDLIVTDRSQGDNRFAARTSITFEPGFESKVENDEFVAEIDPAAATPQTIVNVNLDHNPISSDDLNDPSVCTILKYQFYDNYIFSGAKPFDTNVDNATAYSNSDPNVLSIAITQRTTGFATGSKARVLGTDHFLNTTSYYDERGAQIQTSEDNIKSGSDVVTFQYHFDGRVLSTYSKHTALGTGYTNFSVLTMNEFDQIGRITGIKKKFGSVPDFKTIVKYKYDELGRLKAKHLDPGYTEIPVKSELETLTYSYNIQGNLTGINKDYALKAGNYDKRKNFFGFYLGYDNQDGVFANANKSGQVAGQLWNSQGDDAQRKYDYNYDNAGRLVQALFNERKTVNDTWSNQHLDFSVIGATNNKISYDLNGNLLSMIHKGFLLSSSSPVEVDKLGYAYFDFSNQLKKVTDQSTTIGQANGKGGDFKDGSNGEYNDYVYDANGNLIVDYNKDAYITQASAVDQTTPTPSTATPAIKYNFLDKPEEIAIVGKGTIRFVYDADGNKLQKIFTPQSTTTPVVTTYIGGYVYKGDELQYIGFEEGRIRVMEEVQQSNGYDFVNIGGNLDLPGGKRGVFDYYLRDYQQNVRMILTEETHVGGNLCTMESERASSEEPLFGQGGSGNEVAATRLPVSSIPGQDVGGGWQNPNLGSYVSRLGNLVAKKVGPNVLLKVMSGDEIAANTLYYYKNPATNGTGDNLSGSVLTTLINAITGSAVTGGIATEAGTTISGNLGNVNNPIHGMIAPDAANAEGSSPKAYLTILFFDERFNFISEGSSFVRVSTAGSNNSLLLLPYIKAPKNGYCYVYLSNESDEPVYFDNFRVMHNRGRIVEENHYYAYGLKIAAISSHKLGDALEGKLDNQYLYNDKELIDDADLGWYDYGFRNYDPQIGRFPQLDPLTFAYPFLTPYQYASCDPITNIDVDGLEGSNSVLEPVVVTAKALPRAFRTNLNLTSAFTYATQFIYLNKANQTTQLYEAPMFGNGQSAATNFTDSYGDWELTETRNISFESSQFYDGPAASQAQPVKETGWMRLSRKYRLLYDFINSPIVGAKTLGSGLFGYRKQDVRGLAGEETTRDERFMGGVSLLANAITPMVGAQFRAVKTGRNIVGTAYDEVLPTQDWINPEKVSEYKSMLQNGQKLSPIHAYQQGERIFIEDGHHRFAAYMEMGMKPNMIIRNTGGPIGYPNWLNTTFQTPPIEY